MRVERETWTEDTQATEEKFKSRLKIYPKGVFGIYLNNKLAGVSTSMRTNWTEDFTWEGITDNGLITSHNSTGDTLYVVSLGVSQKPEYRKQGLGSILLERQKQLANELGLNLLLSARVPNYHNYPNLSIQEYLSLKSPLGERIDPEIRFYERNGLVIIKPKYKAMNSDKESLDWGVLMGYNKVIG